MGNAPPVTELKITNYYNFYYNNKNYYYIIIKNFKKFLGNAIIILKYYIHKA